MVGTVGRVGAVLQVARLFYNTTTTHKFGSGSSSRFGDEEGMTGGGWWTGRLLFIRTVSPVTLRRPWLKSLLPSVQPASLLKQRSLVWGGKILVVVVAAGGGNNKP
jgi:hypothetical protein